MIVDRDNVTIDGERAIITAEASPGPTADRNEWPPAEWVALNRACDTCPFDHGDLPSPRCPDCHGTGRHCFPIEVEADYYIEPMHHHVLGEIHTVYVTDILEIGMTEASIPIAVKRDKDGYAVQMFYPSLNAKPGDWAIVCKVVES